MIRDVLIERDITQKELAKIAGMNYRTVNNYFAENESNSVKIEKASLSNLVKLALALKCKISDLLSDEELIEQCRKLGI